MLYNSAIITMDPVGTCLSLYILRRLRTAGLTTTHSTGAESKVNLLSCNLQLHFLRSPKRNKVIYKEKENALAQWNTRWTYIDFKILMQISVNVCANVCKCVQMGVML